MLEKLKETGTGSLYGRKKNSLLSNLQEEISRDVLSKHAQDKFGTFGRVNASGFSRDRSRGPIIDEFSEDSYSLCSNSDSKRTDSSNSKDRQHRRTDKNDSRRRSYSPVDEKLSSNRRSREDTPTKHSRSTDFNPSSQRMDDDVDLRSVLKQFQKSKWEDKTEDVFHSGFSGEYKDDDQEKRGPYNDGIKRSDNREARDYLRTSDDRDHMKSRYGRAKHGSLNDGNAEAWLDAFKESSALELSSLSTDALRDFPVSELAQKVTQKYKTGFELGRPFFGLQSEGQDKERGWENQNFEDVSKGAERWEKSLDAVPDHGSALYGRTMDSGEIKQINRDYLGKYSNSSNLSKSKAGEEDTFDFKDHKTNSSRQKGNSKSVAQPFKSSASTPHTVFSQSNLKGSTSSMQNPRQKPMFPSGFLPRQLQKPVGKNLKNVEVGKGKGLNEPSLFPRKSGYYPRNTKEISRSRSRSSERGDFTKDLGSGIKSSKKEVRPPSKGKFTNQNWLSSDSSINQSTRTEASKRTLQQSVEQSGMPTNRNRGRGGFKRRGRGNLQTKRGGRGTAISPRGRGRGAKGRGSTNGIRGRGTMSLRGRGFAMRGRGRGISQPPVGATVRNIFRRSNSLSPVRSKPRKSSRSPNSPKRDKKRRSERSKNSRSRSRSSSFCSTCSSHSCSTCSSWRSVSIDSLSRKGDRERKRHHKHKMTSYEKKGKSTVKSVEKLKNDIKTLEKQLDQKSPRSAGEKKTKGPECKFDTKTVKGKPKINIREEDKWLGQKTIKSIFNKGKEDSKGTFHLKLMREGSHLDIKEEKKDVKTKEKHSAGKNVPVVKEEKGNKEQQGKDLKDVKREGKKKTDNAREVIFKSDKWKESSKKDRESPVREVKIVNEGKNREDEVPDEKLGSKMELNTLKITIDHTKKRPDTNKDKRFDKGKEKLLDRGNRSSKSPPGKQKKKEKEKVKAKKAKKKAKKRKYDRGSEESGDESVYSSTSGQDESSYRLQKGHSDERIVEFSSLEGFDTNAIAVHYAKREKAKHGKGKIRSNLISVPVSEGADIAQEKKTPPIESSQWLTEQQHGYALTNEGQHSSSSDIPYTEMLLPSEGEFYEGYTESAVGDQDYTVMYQEGENPSQVWPSEHALGDDPNNYYYEEGVEGEGYEQEYYSYGQEGDYTIGDQGENQEWCEGEYSQEGAEGEGFGEYEGEYYLGEDGLYYPVEGEVYQEYQGEYTEGGTDGQGFDPEQGGTYIEGDYQYAEESGVWQHYEEGAVYETEEAWNQGEAEGLWQEEYQEGYHGTESDWNNEYPQEYDAGAQGYAVEGAEVLPEEGYSTGEGYDHQWATEKHYVEEVPVQEEGYHVEHGSEPQQQGQPVTSASHEEPPTLKEDMATAPAVNNVQQSKPLKSILKKSKQLTNNGKGTKLVSERLSQMNRQSAHTTGVLQQSSASSSSIQSVQSVKVQEKSPDQPAAASSQSEAERYREMEEAILSSQPKDAVGTEYVVRVHGSGTANFFCKLCQCHFNTLTAKNLHIKGMKHIELYIRLKSSLLQSVIKDTKVETTKRPADDDPSAAQKIPRRF
ncbi:uncharacterized protein LOC111343742 isoform X2 [Stylophora pistillata]|nr:uncharacterized protein LOC111343742 isoform X2 [Stylophora pistillata]XP_022806661.1 uncharacterized protein LOC111343742 isoform X2 [Stylophora pistillata]XP_022806662.1 uncharacterized protein LOC111343742 isoform X2 [Stylophora pistillata]